MKLKEANYFKLKTSVRPDNSKYTLTMLVS